MFFNEGEKAKKKDIDLSGYEDIKDLDGIG